MPVIAIDLGGTKLASAVFSEDGTLLSEEMLPLDQKAGKAVGDLIISQIQNLAEQQRQIGEDIIAIGVCVPGISYQSRGTVWAPNIMGWENYPLRNHIESVIKNIPVIIDSDRACYIMGEAWQGAAKDCMDAIYLAVGTGIGTGIMINRKVFRGANDIAGAIGWMALEPPYKEEYRESGCFESQASGTGIAATAKRLVQSTTGYNGSLKNTEIDAKAVFEAYAHNDPIAQKIISHAIDLWAMAAANLVSLFNPQKIIFGGGVFGPAVTFIPGIEKEARKWAQPVSINQVRFEPSALGPQSALYGAAMLAIEKVKPSFLHA